MNALRSAAPEPAAAPPPHAPVFEGDPLAAFKARLEVCGGEFARVADLSELGPLLATRWPNLDTMLTWSALPEAMPTSLPEDAQGDPTALQGVDAALLCGAEWVAENAAVWVAADAAPHPALPFLAEHLVLVVARDDLVATMHEAYAQLAQRNEYAGCFIAGPSKTSDIAQCLVIGAQGPRSCLVCAVDKLGALA